MKFDTFTAFTLTAVVGVSAVLLSMGAKADERYMHHCSTNKLTPTLLDMDRPLRRANVAIETRRYYPGSRPKMKVITLPGNKSLFESRLMFHGELKRCYFRNNNWTTAKKTNK